MTCFLTDAEWLPEDLGRGQTLNGLPMDKAAFRVRPDGTELNRLDLWIDFVPVVHIANTIPHGGEHWGQPVVAKVLQGLDELAATDSDSASASATTRTPIIGLAGARLPVDRTTGKPQQLTAAEEVARIRVATVQDQQQATMQATAPGADGGGQGVGGSAGAADQGTGPFGFTTPPRR
ncbi:hypothetical protein [Streptomyces noursei]|uniref:hypothetical protein n=1 Tax=Streptomyces noursei TaxID=1971 RepID=UPI0030F009E8